MDSSDVRFMAVDSASETHFRALQGTVSLGVGSLVFWGLPGIEHLILGAGRLFDLTCGVGGADRVYLCGTSADYRVTVSVASSVMTLTHSTAGTSVRLHMLRGPTFLVFEDGYVSLEALWLRASQSTALLHVLGATRLVGEPTVADHVVVAPQPATGLLPEGALLQMAGRKGVETLYACATSPAVFLDGVRTDYRANLVGRDAEVLTLGRCKHGLWQVAYVMGPAWLHFSDGFVDSSDLRSALKINAAWPPAIGQILPDVPRISAITLDFNVTSGVLDGVDAHVWHAGQLLEINVFLCRSVLVTGAPKLQLRVSGHSRMAVYSGGSGSHALRFIYRLSAYDAAQLQCRGISVGRAQADGYPNVEAGPLWPCGALIVPLTGNAGQSDDHAFWDSRIDIDLDEIEATESLDIDLNWFESQATPRAISHLSP